MWFHTNEENPVRWRLREEQRMVKTKTVVWCIERKLLRGVQVKT